MKKVFGLFLSLIVLMGLSACEPELPDEPQKPNPEPIPEETGCLTFVSSGESLVALAKVGAPFDISLEYSLDGKSWNPYTIRKAIYLSDGGELSFRAGETGNERFSKGSLDNYRFIISGSVAAKGNVMSLLDRSCRRNAVPANAFFYLFCDCTVLTEAPKLPATELAEGCYTQMFEGCTKLTEAPALPATELAEECYYGMFDGCTSLTEAPELPATKLAKFCYGSMFYDCTGLTEAPDLPATELAEYCYASMFKGCTSLTEGPSILPAKNLAKFCYGSMFYDCTGLTKAPDLLAANLAEQCYFYMFYCCTSLTEAPDLPAMELAEDCYQCMFIGCTSLTEAPELPATKLAKSCYSEMFQDCTNLTKAPDLPATDLDYSCYERMFSGCTNLNYIKALFTDEPSIKTTEGWLSGVAPTGTFVRSKDATWDVRGDDGIPEGWTVESDAGTSDDPQKPNPDEPSYLTFVSSGESTISLIKNGYPDPITLEYSTNDSAWTPYTIGETISLLDGEKLMFRAGIVRNKSFSCRYEGYYNFKISGSVAAMGNIMSLLDRKCSRNSVPSYTFFNLFSDCTGLTSAPELPATELAEFCYRRMFYGCTKLTTGPELPATNLAKNCYWGMFYGCTNLTKAPDLPATNLASGCYTWMFRGCTSLTKAPELPAMTLAPVCYNGMFRDCPNLTEAPDLPATNLASGCYWGMFYGCASLTNAPDLPATELAESCYSSMFEGCTSLSYIKALFTDEPSRETTGGWVSGVALTGTFVKSKDATWDVWGDSGIPKGWTVESDAGASYLTFVSTGESTVSLVKNGDPALITLEYSTNDSAWTPYTIGETISLLDGEKLMFRAGKDGNDYFSLNSSHYYNFKISGSVAAKGNIMSLLDRSCHKKIVPSHAFNSLFKYCEALTSAPTLSATKLGNNCYYCMFRGCTSLTEAPALPAKVMAKVCYSGMFWGCTSLMKAPELPAMELAEYCYGGMFRDCISLTEAPELSATELASSCYGSMFKGCTSLTKAPVLPATELARACYSGMFQGCMILNYVKALFTDEPSKETTREWLLGVSPTGTFVKSKDATWDVRRKNGIPKGWTVITE